jgi:hypothetical protein
MEATQRMRATKGRLECGPVSVRQWTMHDRQPLSCMVHWRTETGPHSSRPFVALIRCVASMRGVILYDALLRLLPSPYLLPR